jgi:hypothetical protein
MILGHLPGLQDDAFFYYAWTLPHTIFFLFCIILPSHFTIIFVDVSRAGKGLASRALAMHRFILSH